MFAEEPQEAVIKRVAAFIYGNNVTGMMPWRVITHVMVCIVAMWTDG